MWVWWVSERVCVFAGGCCACVFVASWGRGISYSTLIEESRMLARKNVQRAMARMSLRIQLLVMTHARTMHAHPSCGRSNTSTESAVVSVQSAHAIARLNVTAWMRIFKRLRSEACEDHGEQRRRPQKGKPVRHTQTQETTEARKESMKLVQARSWRRQTADGAWTKIGSTATRVRTCTASSPRRTGR